MGHWASATLPLEESRVLKSTRVMVAAIPCYPRHSSHQLLQSDAAWAQVPSGFQTKPVWVPAKTRRWAVLEHLPVGGGAVVVMVVVVVVLLLVAALAAKVVLQKQKGKRHLPLKLNLRTVLWMQLVLELWMQLVQLVSQVRQVLDPLLLLLLHSLGGTF